MTYQRRSQTQNKSIPAGLAIGVISAFVILICGTALLAKLVNIQVLTEENTKYGIMILLLITSFAASIISYRKTERQRVIMCAGTGVICFLILISITVLFFDSEFTGVPETAGLIFCGSTLAILPGLRPEKRRKTSKLKI